LFYNEGSIRRGLCTRPRRQRHAALVHHGDVLVVQGNNSFTGSAQVVTNMGATAIITVNYGSGTAAEAAAWVKCSNVTNHYGFKYWEVGNEEYGTYETDNHARPHDPYTYATNFAAYLQQMKAAAYAALRTNGSLTLMAINKQSASNYTANIQLSNFVPSGTAKLYSYGVPQDNAAQAGNNSACDIQTNTISGVSANFNCTLAPYSVTVSNFVH
jgi:alpha-L-arabinofuranosidase